MRSRFGKRGQLVGHDLNAVKWKCCALIKAKMCHVEIRYMPAFCTLVEYSLKYGKYWLTIFDTRSRSGYITDEIIVCLFQLFTKSVGVPLGSWHTTQCGSVRRAGVCRASLGAPIFAPRHSRAAGSV